MQAMHRLALVACISCAATTAWAQSEVRPNQWSRGTTLIGAAGVATDGSQTGPVIGGTVSWDLTPRFAIEGTGSWLQFGEGTDGFGGSLKVRGRLFGGQRMDSFVLGGVGLYRASFGVREDRMPEFYLHRTSTQLQTAGSGATFTDPTVVGGAGVNIVVNRRFAIRPDVEAVIVLRDRRSLVVTSVALHAVYHFEGIR